MEQSITLTQDERENKRMTLGELAIWAAVYAEHRARGNALGSSARLATLEVQALRARTEDEDLDAMPLLRQIVCG